MDEIETWLVIAEFPDYEVSDLGRVRSNKRKTTCLLKPWKHSFGYSFVTLSVRGFPQQKRLIHQLVCQTFHGPKPSVRHACAHSDGNPKNNRADNLRWALPTENNADKRRHGTHLNSGQFPRKLSTAEVRTIRELALMGTIPQRRIAEWFGIHQTAVSAIKRGERRADD
jgi:hypothetical protein